MPTRKKYAIVGASRRALGMFVQPVVNEFSGTVEIAALCDLSPIRMGYLNQELPEPAPIYTDFDRMLKENEIDAVIVTTKDSVHHEFITRSLHAGKDVITEKPMTIDAEKCRAILKAERETGRKVTVTFNYRFAPPMTAIRRILAEGTIGRVVTVDMQWPLNTMHGAEYFRRWHRNRADSGGLQVHKSTHHFDLVNWWLQDEPVAVAAQGGLDFYGKNGPFRHRHCRGCPHRHNCNFYWDITQSITSSDSLRRFSQSYLDAEAETGYVRDGCVFDESIDIEDNYMALVKFKGGARLAYSLQAWSAWEGLRVEMQGTKGRLEYSELHGTHDWESSGSHQIKVTLIDGSVTIHQPPKGFGAHGGGDPLMRRMLFESDVPDPLEHMAGAEAGARSILVGVAATESMQNDGKWVNIDNLLSDD